MRLIKKKTRKRISKQVRKLVKKHGEEVVAGLVTTAVSAAAAKFAHTADEQPKKHKKAKKHKDLSPSSISV